jgi:hypothetical protein
VLRAVRPWRNGAHYSRLWARLPPRVLSNMV